MPPGGDGFYYFSVFLLVNYEEYAFFEIQINGAVLCTAYADQQSTTFDAGQAVCSAAVYATEGLYSLDFCSAEMIDPDLVYVIIYYIYQVTRLMLCTKVVMI